MEDLYNQAIKLGLHLEKLEVLASIREREMVMERGVVGEWIGSKRKKKNSILRGQQDHSFNK